MKIKAGINVASIKAALVEHGEKVAFGLAGLGLLVFAYSALTRETLAKNRQPQDLLNEAAEADRRIESAELTRKYSDPEILSRATTKISLPEVAISTINPPVLIPKLKRPDLEHYPLEEPRATAGVGTFAVKKKTGKGKDKNKQVALLPLPKEFGPLPGLKPPAKTQLESYHWVVVTAVVPLVKQAALYDTMFRPAEGYLEGVKVPTYSGYKVQRMEMPSGEWSDLPMSAIAAIEDNWFQKMQDVTVTDYTDSHLRVPKSYIAPLGSLVGADWDESVAHPPQIAFQHRLAKVNAGPQEGESEAPQGDAVKPVALGAAPGKLNDRLFRFFDYTVVAGKQYRYRVKLQVKNPNYEMAAKFLDDPTSAQVPTRETAFSEPTPVVTVPIGGGMYAGPVTPARGMNDTTVKLLISMLDPESALEATIEMDAARGSLLNRPAQSVQVIDPRGPGIRTLDSVSFITNSVVVDIQGGGPLGKDKSVSEPGEVLIAGMDDSLSVHIESQDAAAYKVKLVPDSPKESKAAGGGKPFGDDPLLGGGGGGNRGAVNRSAPPKKNEPRQPARRTTR